ncbi:MAG: aspartate-semialdehyde dehydrogenase [Porticoccaceae bacterium]
MTATPMIDIAVVGATGAVGEAILSVLSDRGMPLGKVHALASAASLGETAMYGNRSLPVASLAEFDFSQVAIAVFAVPATVAAEFVPVAVAAGALVVDCSAQFRDDFAIPLVVAEVNPEDIAAYSPANIVAIPGASATLLATVLKPIYDEVGIRRINVATYQGVSSAGKRGLTELAGQAANLLSGKPVTAAVFPRQIAFNLIPQIGGFMDNQYSSEETALVGEMRRLFADPALEINPTCVQVPVFYGQCQAVHLETQYPLGVDQVRTLLRRSPGVAINDRGSAPYATPVGNIEDDDRLFVGRIRQAIAGENGINLWLLSDNLRKGAALNSIQIAEQLIKFHL